MPTRSQFRHEDVAAPPRGYRVRTITHPSGHRVRIAFPPGPRRRGAGRLVSILHPRAENPTYCVGRTKLEEFAGANGHNPRRNQEPLVCWNCQSEQVVLREGIKPGETGYGLEYLTCEQCGAAGDVEDFLASNPRKSKAMTREQVEKLQDRAVTGLRNLGQDDEADDVADLSVEEYAEKKKIKLTNPKQRTGAWQDVEFRGIPKSARLPGGSSPQAIRAMETVAERWAARAGHKWPWEHLSNPDEGASAAALYEDFHGAPSKETLEFQQEILRRKDYAALGDLVELRGNGWGIEFGPQDQVLLASNAEGSQLYLIGGNQDVSALIEKAKLDATKDFLDLGALHVVTYRTRKHFDRFEETDYVHKMGEGGHAKPCLIYDKLNRQLYIVGGEYRVKDVGIVH